MHSTSSYHNIKSGLLCPTITLQQSSFMWEFETSGSTHPFKTAKDRKVLAVIFFKKGHKVTFRPGCSNSPHSVSVLQLLWSSSVPPFPVRAAPVEAPHRRRSGMSVPAARWSPGRGGTQTSRWSAKLLKVLSLARRGTLSTVHKTVCLHH